ncbi:MAG: DUF4345 domain-containing protein [Gammaproteobacteria bacterium]|nr:DUF4345 domain-containing protein [Gammaproteobacteria bacterium]
MKNSKVLKTILIISGLIASGIGAAILFAPVAFYATYGIELSGDISLLNEIRAPGSALLAIGLLIISGAFVEKLTFSAAVISTVLFLSYGLSRVMSIAIDGMPVEGLVQAAVLEIVIGLACIFALVKYREKQKEFA